MPPSQIGPLIVDCCLLVGCVVCADRRFVSLYSLWFSSLPLGVAAVAPAFSALSQFAQSAAGPDAGYYQLEVIRAAFSTYAQAHNPAGSFSAYTQLEQHPFYLAMLDGHVKLTRFTIGHRSHTTQHNTRRTHITSRQMAK